ncbi:hypothetical protein CRG98_038875 [Punica granatum]|uniref:Uncharacterized protein n=1 Tax=Punica granatum TaxID=22663 RepID=A0A2I0I9R1_PUNGR|nr:hypothetical protein CRG98_038875 [Punica granatum]
MQGVNSDSDSDRIGLCVPGPSGVIFWPSFPYLRPLCYATVIFCYVPPLLRQKYKVSHELPFCGVVAGPIGDWPRKALSDLRSLGAKGKAGSMGPLTSSYVLCGSREANEGKLNELSPPAAYVVVGLL